MAIPEGRKQLHFFDQDFGQESFLVFATVVYEKYPQDLFQGHEISTGLFSAGHEFFSTGCGISVRKIQKVKKCGFSL